jgi:hypothetical protein
MRPMIARQLNYQPVNAEAIRHYEGKWAVAENAWLGTATMGNPVRTVVGDRQGPD